MGDSGSEASVGPQEIRKNKLPSTGERKFIRQIETKRKRKFCNISTVMADEVDSASSMLDSMKLEVEGENGKASVLKGDGDSQKNEKESKEEIKFYPPVYCQRYVAVQGILEKYLALEEDKSPKAVLDVGCAQYKMLMYLKNLSTVEKIIFLDKDETVLDLFKDRLRPIPADYFTKLQRKTPLNVVSFAGDITKLDKRLFEEPQIWAVLAIEVIEHLETNILDGFETSVFGGLKPKLVIITTPNQEFNVVFNLSDKEFRHWDHKFEWKRKEFEEWCQKICSKYPEYSYEIQGVCPSNDPRQSHLGCVSQLAVFKRDGDMKATTAKEACAVANCYQLIEYMDFPYFKDDRTPAQIILDELSYIIHSVRMTPQQIEFYEENNVEFVVITIESLRSSIKVPFEFDNNEFFKEVLDEAGYDVRANPMIPGQYHVVLSVAEYSEKLLELIESFVESEDSIDSQPDEENVEQLDTLADDTCNENWEDDAAATQ